MTFKNFSHRGFTLIEMTIAMTIFAVMIVIILSVYFNITETSRRLNAARYLAESARALTEQLSQDIRRYGVGEASPAFDPNYPWWAWYSYTDGSEYINIGNKWRYVYGVKIPTGMLPCIDSVELRKTNPAIHCGLYYVPEGDNGANAMNLIDTFVPDEDKKRVKVESFRFYITGKEDALKKVTVSFTLALMPKIGVPRNFINSTKIHIQTTMSERAWRE
jgi:prepilin-type N-terminal cleavage/methylation domain-containing protein